MLKYRLSEMVDSDHAIDLQTAEHFQNEFIHIDEKLESLSRSLLNFSGKYGPEKEGKTALKEHDLLRERIYAIEKKYLDIALEFNKKMLPAA